MVTPVGFKLTCNPGPLGSQFVGIKFLSLFGESMLAVLITNFFPFLKFPSNSQKKSYIPYISTYISPITSFFLKFVPWFGKCFFSEPHLPHIEPSDIYDSYDRGYADYSLGTSQRLLDRKDEKWSRWLVGSKKNWNEPTTLVDLLVLFTLLPIFVGLFHWTMIC